jgi:hypothetical protein
LVPSVLDNGHALVIILDLDSRRASSSNRLESGWAMFDETFLGTATRFGPFLVLNYLGRSLVHDCDDVGLELL